MEEADHIVSADIFVTPPDNDDLSDEDSGSEDTGDIGNHARRQLLAEAEVRCQVPSSEGVVETVDGIPFINESEQDPHPSTSYVVYMQRKPKQLRRRNEDKRIYLQA